MQVMENGVRRPIIAVPEARMDLLFVNNIPDDGRFTIWGAVGRFTVAYVAAVLIGFGVSFYGIPAPPGGAIRPPDAGQGEGIVLALFLGLSLAAAPFLGLVHQAVSVWFFRRGFYGLICAAMLGAVLFAVATVPFLNVAESRTPFVILAVAGATYGIPLGIINWMMVSVGRDGVGPVGFAALAMTVWMTSLVQPSFWNAIATAI